MDLLDGPELPLQPSHMTGSVLCDPRWIRVGLNSVSVPESGGPNTRTLGQDLERPQERPPVLK